MQKTSEKHSLSKDLFRVAIPIMIANLLQSLYNLADTYYLGSLEVEAVSAPSITNNITNFLIVFGTGFSLAGTSLISQMYGRTQEKGKNLDKLASQVFFINIIMSLIVVLVGRYITVGLCRLMNVPKRLTMY